MAATSIKSALSGLPRRLAQDGIIDEAAAIAAKSAAKEQKVALVTYLVTEGLAQARDVAIAASEEFGVPLLDLGTVDVDIDVVRVVDEKLVSKHRVLPLIKRGKRLFVATSDPTNLAALDEIKFQTSLKVDPVVVEQAELEERITKALEAVDTSMS